MKENLYPGEKLILRLDGMSHISRGRAELGTLFLTNYHIIYNPQYVYETGKITFFFCFLRKRLLYLFLRSHRNERGPRHNP